MTTQTEIPLDQEGEFDDLEWLKPANLASEIQEQQSDLEGYYSIYEDQLRINQRQRRDIASAQTDGLQDILNFGKSITDVVKEDRRKQEEEAAERAQLYASRVNGLGISVEDLAEAMINSDSADQEELSITRLAGHLSKTGNEKAAAEILKLSQDELKHLRMGVLLNYANNAPSNLRRILNDGEIRIDGKVYSDFGINDDEDRLAYINKVQSLYLERAGLLDLWDNKFVIRNVLPAIDSAANTIFNDDSEALIAASNKNYGISWAYKNKELLEFISTTNLTGEALTSSEQYRLLTGSIQELLDRYQGKNNAEAVDLITNTLVTASLLSDINLNTELRDRLVNLKINTTGGPRSLAELFDAFKPENLELTFADAHSRMSNEKSSLHNQFALDQVRACSQTNSCDAEVLLAQHVERFGTTPSGAKSIYQQEIPPPRDQAVEDEIEFFQLHNQPVPLSLIQSIPDPDIRERALKIWNIDAGGRELQKYLNSYRLDIDREIDNALVRPTRYAKLDDVPGHEREGVKAVFINKDLSLDFSLK